MNNQQKVVFRTPQSLVHIRHSITLMQYKCWFLLLQEYKEHLQNGSEVDEDGFVYIPISKISNYLGYKPSVRDLKDDLEVLRQEPITINYLGKDGRSATHGTGFVSEWRVAHNKVGFVLPSFLKTVLMMDKETERLFSILNWNIFGLFTSKYEAIIYKLCKDYLPDGETPLFTVDYWREYIGLGSEYPEFKKLNQITIALPVENINQSSFCDLSIEVEYFRESRKVHSFKFKIRPRRLDIPTNSQLPELYDCFNDMRVMYDLDKQIALMEKYTEEQVAAIIQRANDYATDLESNKKKVNISAIYHKAFAEGWGLEELNGKKAREEAKRIKKEKQIQEQAEAELKTEAKAKYRESIETAFFSLDKDQQEAILDSIEMVLDPVFSKTFKKDRKAGIIPTSLFTFHLAKVEKALFQQYS